MKSNLLTIVWLICVAILMSIGGASAQGSASSALRFTTNARSQHDYARQTQLPVGFGSGEFTLEVWIRPDNSFPVGSVGQDTPEQLINWSDADFQPYSVHHWWYIGNFLLDGHNNNDPAQGTFSLQFYGAGRVRWLFGDGACNCPGGHWGIGAYPAANAPSLLDGNWHQLTLVRRWVQPSGAQLELWINGVLIDTEFTPARTNMYTTFWQNWSGFPTEQPGWFWGAEKQAAVPIYIQQYEDYKGLVDELRFWSRAKTASEIAADWRSGVTGTETGLMGWYSFSEASGTTTCDTLNPTQCMTLLRMLPGYWSAQNAPVIATPPAQASVNGQVALQGRSAGTTAMIMPLTVERITGGVVQSTHMPTTDVQGAFSVATLPTGAARLRVKAAGYLASAQEVMLVGGANALSFGTLRAGDVNNDNRVTLLDFSALAGSFNRSGGQPGWNANADLNGDGVVSLVDFSLLASNFNQVGD
jgi:hypothetical protein